VRLLELPEAIQQLVRQGKISFGHARAILTVADPSEQMTLASRIMEEGLSVRQIEALMREPNPTTAQAIPKPPGRQAALPKTNHLISLEEGLKRRFGARVEIRPKSNDKGTILIHFTSHEEFDRLMENLGAA